MKNGFRVYDVDTHINPGAEVLDKYVDPSFRPRLPELAPYKVAIQSREAGGGERHIYRFDEKVYERTLGEAKPRRGSRDSGVWGGELAPPPGRQAPNPPKSVAERARRGGRRHFSD